MFLVTTFRVDNDCRRERKTFHSLVDAEEFCDWRAANGWTVYSLECVDFTITNNLLESAK
jgi:hypothetical protein